MFVRMLTKWPVTTKPRTFFHSTGTYQGFSMGYKVNEIEKVPTIRKLTFLSVEMDKNIR